MAQRDKAREQRAFGYVRVSKLDDKSTSPQRQRQAIAKWCRDHGARLVDTFEDLDLSAYRKGVRRPGLEQMLGRLGEVDIVVGMRLDRLARSVSAFSKLLDTFEAAGVKLATTDGEIDTSTAGGRAIVQMKSIFAELESGTISERARAMHTYKRERGEWVGRVPFGFRLDGNGLEVDPETFPVLEEAARRYVAGESLRRIASDVGIHHPNLAKRLRSDRVIDALPPALAARLVESLAERGRTGTRAKRSLLGGIARCGVCGAGMTVFGQRSGWAAYSCRERQHVSISKPWLDQYVTRDVLEAIDTGKLLRRLSKRKRPRRALASSEIEARLELLEVDHYERGIVARESFLRRREGLLRRLAQTREAEQEAGIDLPREFAANLAFRWKELSILEQRRIVAAVLNRIDVGKAIGHGPIEAGRVKLVWRG